MATMTLSVVSGTEAQGAPECRIPAGHATTRADIRIDGWLVRPSLNMLNREDVHVRLRPQLMDMLMCLASDPGTVFTQDELVDAVWDGRFIASSGISRCIAELRSALGDDARKPRVIETITKRGYRLIAPVQPVAPREAVPEAATEPVAGRGEAPARAAARAPEGEMRLLWRRIERVARLLAQRAQVRAFRS